MSTPLVSVCMITYKHENFIREAIEGVVSQETNFPFELVISEDCGPDKTLDICREYQTKYPDIIRIIDRKHNLGPQPNFVDTVSKCIGKYIALCEGDDYWIDANKLQKQVDFLESNMDYVMSAHGAYITHNNVDFNPAILPKDSFTTEEILLQHWGIMTATILFVREALNAPAWFVDVKNGDMALQLLLSLKGKIAYLQEAMSVYRDHPNGVSASLRPLNQASWLTFLLFHFNEHTQGKYFKIVKKRIKRMYEIQLLFAKQYHLRREFVKLKYYQILSSVFPFSIKKIRK